MRNKSLKTNKEFPILKPETSEDEDSVPSGIITPTTIHLETDDSESNEINSSDDSNDHHLGLSHIQLCRSLQESVMQREHE